MSPLDSVNLVALMQRTSGIADVKIALIDGPVAIDNPGLNAHRISEISGSNTGYCRQADSVACQHGTFVAAILAARRGSSAPAICPECSLLVRPIFAETVTGSDGMPSATPEVLAKALLESIAAGARVVNLSLGLAHLTSAGANSLKQALDVAAHRDVLTVSAAGNQGTVGSSSLTRHPWVIPVAACDESGVPLPESNLGGSIGRNGFCAPGDRIVSLGSTGQSITSRGTSVAAPFVTGAIALLWSEFPSASASQIKNALRQSAPSRRPSIVPPLLNAWAAYQYLERHGA